METARSYQNVLTCQQIHDTRYENGAYLTLTNAKGAHQSGAAQNDEADQ